MKFIVCSYYTADTGYEEESKRLIESARKFAVPIHMEAINTLGGWYENTAYKAVFIREMLDTHKHCDIVWVDCDAEFRAYPKLFAELHDRQDIDMAARIRNWRVHKNEMLSGTLYFKNDFKSREICDDWNILNCRNPRIFEQLNLQAAVEQHPDVAFYDLPAEYCAIFDYLEECKKEPIILHHQASRKYKNRMG